MRNFKNYLAFLAVFALLFTSCSKDESNVDDGSADNATLSFGAILKDFADNKEALKSHVDDLPECSDGTPTTVHVALQDADGNWVADQNGNNHEFIAVPINSTPGDYNDDGVETWFTEESSELELSAGIYTIEYFAVLDENGNTMWIAPRGDGEYGNAAFQNFVDEALPVSVDLRNGVKKYADIEVLCYDEHFVNEYGYMFFDFGDTDIITFCAFGNICPPDGRHYPANFRMDVWTFSGDDDNPKGTPLFNENDPYINTYGQHDNGDWYAEPLCVALPDTEDTDFYYAEITLIEDGVETSMIRNGVFSDADVLALFDESTNTAEPYHFREGCEGEDSDPILEDPDDDGNGDGDNGDGDNGDGDNGDGDNGDGDNGDGDNGDGDNGDGDDYDDFCETAFMLGDYTFLSDDDALTIGNNWGWARMMEAGDGDYSYEVWAAAGQNDLTSGMLVGEVNIEVDGDNVAVTIDLDDGLVLRTTHIYLSDDAPVTTAPGQYGNTDDDVDQNMITYNLSVNDANDDGFWMIVHADVCSE